MQKLDIGGLRKVAEREVRQTMSSPYTEHAEKWKALADIDYFTQFVKAWIPFNAWYRTYYPNLTRDWQAINEIKSTSNKFRDRLIALLTGADNESKAFRSYVSSLHYELERKYIYSRGGRITFQAVLVEKNPDKLKTHSYRGITYTVERGPGGRPEKEIKSVVLNTAGVPILSHTQTNRFDLDDLRACAGFSSLSPTQRKMLEVCYTEVDPDRTTSLLTTDSEHCIEMGSYRFIDDTEMLCKGIIEILYQLRNSLFHGAIIPDKDTNKVYEPAYHMLKMLIQAL